MNNSRFFRREIKMIDFQGFQDFISWYFDNKVGVWFWKSGASASGKFHPSFAQGDGGLVRHTRAVSLACEELLRMSTYAYMKDEYKDFARMACLLHDTCKYGSGDEEDSSAYAEHGKLAADAVAQAWFEYFGSPCSAFLYHAILSHMGQWTPEREDRPVTNIDRLVHLADYIASRSFFDIPSISAEYKEDAEG